MGAYALSDSPYGTYDQGGNVFEWNEQIVGGSSRGARGGAWAVTDSYLAASDPHQGDPAGEANYAGFRVASAIPEPGTGLLMMTGLLGLASRRRRPAQAF